MASEGMHSAAGIARAPSFFDGACDESAALNAVGGKQLLSGCNGKTSIQYSLAQGGVIEDPDTPRDVHLRFLDGFGDLAVSPAPIDS